ncbi:LacI family DNA-binding transcriptional regulator [Streptosporangium saharense]|uniref:LacI family DNA-binding transcriptional regulator n=1 Tax=Streptosporangium saharense TaxID=1706840 RepID=UPI0036A0F67D
MKARITSRDVAQAAGVSQSTVSLVLTGKWPGRVSAETADRIRRITAEMDYQPDLAARSLRLERTGTVLLIVPAITNVFFANLHVGATQVANQYDTSVLVYPMGTDRHERLLPIPQQAIDGMLVYGAVGTESIRPQGVMPLVPLDCDPRLYPDAVNVDIAVGSREAARHLLDLGHHRIGYLHVERRGAWMFTTRLRSLRAVVRHRAGATLTVAGTTFDPVDAHRAALELLRSDPPPTAVVCEDDNLAVVVFSVARSLGLDIPNDLSVIGYNNLPISDVLHPTLTTVNIPVTELGAAGAQALHDRLAAREPRPVALRSSLVVRHSTAPPRQA